MMNLSSFIIQLKTISISAIGIFPIFLQEEIGMTPGEIRNSLKKQLFQPKIIILLDLKIIPKAIGRFMILHNFQIEQEQ